MTTYKTVITQAGLDLINESVLNGESAIICDGWYMALGVGELEPSIETTGLINPIYDKNSEGYLNFNIGTDEIYGRYAALRIPADLEGNVIREVGMFDANDNLIICANTYIDMTEGMQEGIVNSFIAAMSLAAVPSDIKLMYLPMEGYTTVEGVNAQIESIIGDLAELETVNKDDLVSALNEIKNSANEITVEYWV